ncbi:MAG: transporter substrate-binding domain-containing protein [Oscillospiraceae bacterium]|nr:transporter substrate-binding domain-containing protein [Oscillospiraceae bacterium]
MKRFVSIFLAVAMAAMLFAGCGEAGEKKEINSPADFEGAIVSAQSGTTAYDYLEAMRAEGVNIDTRYPKQVLNCFDDLRLGRVDAVLVDSVVSAYYTKDSDEYKRAWLSDEGEPLGICMRKDSAGLAAAVEAAIDTMYYDGTMAEIAIKNFGENFTEGLRDVTEAPALPEGFQTIAAGVLTVGTNIGYPPMEYLAEDSKTFIGFDIDVANALGEVLGLEVKIVDTAWEGIFMALEKGEYDCIISSVSITPERQEKYILTEPYVSNALCIVTKA